MEILKCNYINPPVCFKCKGELVQNASVQNVDGTLFHNSCLNDFVRLPPKHIVQPSNYRESYQYGNYGNYKKNALFTNSCSKKCMYGNFG